MHIIRKQKNEIFMNTIIVRALAKINLAIDILNKREDGYHEIDMVSIPLKLHDSIEITPFADKEMVETYLYCDDPTIICDESNLAYKALNIMKEKNRVSGHFQMMIHKRIPVQAGLGGGSSDAAAVIRALDNFAKDKSNLGDIEEEIALKVSSDVPFFIKSKPCRVTGIGEKLEEITIKNHYHVLIVKPDIGLSTKEIYEAYDYIKEEIQKPNIEELVLALKNGDETLMKKNMINVLSYPAIKALPIIQQILNELDSFGLILNGMSGTGSACFALSKDKKIVEHAYNLLSKKGYSCYLTETI